MKNSILVFIALIIVLASPSAALAQTSVVSRSREATSGATATSSAKPAVNAKMEAFRAKGVKEIDRRLNTLNQLMLDLNGSMKLSNANKTALAKEITDEISGLTDLKSKIVADTDIAMLRTHIKEISDDYRVYALIVPKIQILVAADQIWLQTEKMATVSAKLEMSYNEASAAGTNVKSWRVALDDLAKQLANAQTEIVTLENSVLPLQPTGYPANKSVLQKARRSLDTARASLKIARKDIDTVYKAWKGAMADKTANTRMMMKETTMPKPATASPKVASTSAKPL